MGFLSPGIWSKNPGAKATNNAVGITIAAAFMVDWFLSWSGDSSGAGKLLNSQLAGNAN